MKIKLLPLILCAGMLLFAGCQSDGEGDADTTASDDAVQETITQAEVITVNYTKSGEIITNPGMGWVLYGLPSDQSFETLAMGKTGYMRFEWSTLNPEEGVYNWEPVQRYIDEWSSEGMQFSFGVMSANTSGSALATPMWVFDKGAAYTMGPIEQDSTDLTHYIPVWDDPVYVEECAKFAAAMAEQFDGNPDVAFIDIRNYGNWGEMHNYPFQKYAAALDDEGIKPLIQPYIDSFKKTRLVLCWPEPPFKNTSQWAVDNNIGLRRDGMMGRMGWGGSRGDEIALAKDKTPIIWEFISGYRGLENQEGRPWNDEDFFMCLEMSTPDYIGMGQWGDDAQYMYSQKEELIKKAANMMGYHFAMTKASFTNMVTADEAGAVEVTIENSGVNRQLTDCVVKLTLLGSDNKEVTSYVTDWDMGSILAGQTASFTAQASFADAPAGTYQLVIGLFRDAQDKLPTYKMENSEKARGGFYVLGDIRIK